MVTVKSYSLRERGNRDRLIKENMNFLAAIVDIVGYNKDKKITIMFKEKSECT